MKKLTLLGVVLSAALLAAAPVSLHWSPAKTLSLSLDKAAARVGRPSGLSLQLRCGRHFEPSADAIVRRQHARAWSRPRAR